MDNHDDRLEDIQRQLGELPGEILAAIGARPGGEDWPEPPQSSGGAAPDVGGSSASQFEPVVQRLEGVARMLEQRLGDQAGGWGSPPKVYEQQSLSGLIGQMPIPQAIGFADQSWGVPPQMATGTPRDEPFRFPEFKDELTRPQREEWTPPPLVPQQPASADPGAPPAGPASVGAAPAGDSWPAATAPPGMPQAATSATAEGGGDVSGSLVSELQQLRQEIAELRQAMGNTGRAEPASPNQLPVQSAPGQPQGASGGPGSSPFDLPELPPHAVPSAKQTMLQGGTFPSRMMAP